MPPLDASHLFHPKKKPSGSSQKPSPGANGAPGTPQKKRPPRPRPKPEEEDPSTAPPEGPFAEFKLMSSALNGWKYDVMKFESRKPVDVMQWSMPVKLNRKESRRDEPSTVQAPVAAGLMLGPDGKPVIGIDGKPVQVDADGRPIRSGEPSGSQSSDKGKEKAAAAKKRNQKKTRQVHLIPEEIRQLRREERYPWVIEDSGKSEVWVGKMEEVAKSETHAMFMPAANDVFKFVPAHRWYKFQKKPHYHVPSLEEAETLMTQIQKNKDPERWLLRKRNGQGPSEATAAMFKSEREGSVLPSSGSLEHTSSQSLGPGGRRLRTVDTGGLFGDDDDEDGGRRRVKKELGAEGDLDELDFEEDFADDEEKVEGEADDEEAKEAEERIKREYKSANKTREGYIDESEEEEEEPKLSMAGKDMRKLMKKLEKNLAYDESDDDKNPYASSDESSSEEEPPPVPQGPAIIPPDPKNTSRSSSQAPPATNGVKNLNGSQPSLTVKTEPSSRPTSPVASPSHGGHSVVAKRATSPKAPKGNLNGSRASSPLAGGTGSRATSPVAGVGSRASSPVAQSPVAVKPNNKRKATDDPTSPTTGQGAPVKPKKRKPAPAPVGELNAQMLVEWLKVTPNATTRDCIQHFQPYLRKDEDKKRFANLVKEVALLKDNVLHLRSNLRKDNGGTSTPATAPSPTAGGGAQ